MTGVHLSSGRSELKIIFLSQEIKAWALVKNKAGLNYIWAGHWAMTGQD